jgi:hypothetical protein
MGSITKISRRRVLATPLLLGGGALLLGAGVWNRNPTSSSPEFTLRLRSRVEAFRGTRMWDEVIVERTFEAQEMAVILCDVWDVHPCRGADERMNVMVQQMATFVDRIREKGAQIIHAPSDTMAFYKDTPQRRRMMEAPAAVPVNPVEGLTDPPLPINDGCATELNSLKWTRQHPTIRIAPEDGISDSGEEIYNFLQQRVIHTVFFMGFHTNLCILNRSFGIRQMMRWGVACILIRDMTDIMYNPDDYPRLSHANAAELAVRHIEKYWCPSILSSEILQGLPVV